MATFCLGKPLGRLGNTPVDPNGVNVIPLELANALWQRDGLHPTTEPQADVADALRTSQNGHKNIKIH